jgi:hypothetical protein
MKIHFKGEEYCLLAESLDESGAIAPMEHCDERGELRPECFLEESFAHYYPDRGIMRFGNVIGSREDIEVLTT